IKELVAKEGETIDVGELMCYIQTTESQESEEEKTSEEKTTDINTQEAESKDQSMKKRYSPAMMRLDQENNIDLEQVTGTGRGGRITRKDIEKIISLGNIPPQQTKETEPEQTQAVEQPTERVTAMNTPKPESQPGDIEIPVTGVRKAIAANMVKSKTEIPHAWMTVEVDVTDLVTYRNELKDEFRQNEGFGLTFFAFFVKAVAQALKEYPELNST